MDFATRYGPWALVTGASAGLGVDYARQLAARGLKLILTARREERLRDLAQELETAHGTESLVVPLDLVTEGAVAELDRAVGEREVGLVVANAGFGGKGPFLAGDAGWDAAMVRLNCIVPVEMAHRWIPPMVPRARGGLIVVASTAAFQATPDMAVYGATKVFDLHLAEALAEEFGPGGIDVLAICPGTTDTEFHAVAGGIATFGNMAKPEDVVRLSLDRLPRRGSVVEGFRNKVMTFANRFAPRKLSTRIAGRIIRGHKQH